MIKETGRVMAVESDYVWVETINRSTCGSCAAEKGCGQSLLARWAAKSAYLKVPLGGRESSDFQIHDQVAIGIPEDVIVKSSLLIYCFPLLTLLAGAAFGNSLGTEAASVAGALLGLAAGGMLVKLYSTLTSRNPRLQPVLLDLVVESPASIAPIRH